MSVCPKEQLKDSQRLRGMPSAFVRKGIVACGFPFGFGGSAKSKNTAACCMSVLAT